MSLLREIMKIVTNGGSLEAALLKTRLLAAKLDSHAFEEWVKHELTGYPKDVDVPGYRMTEIYYTRTFTNGAWQYIDQPIPSDIIRALKNDQMVDYPVRDGIHAVDDALKQRESGKSMILSNSANIKAQIGDKIFKDLHCLRLMATIPETVFTNIDGTVRARLLEFLITLEKNAPEAVDITIDYQPESKPETSMMVTNFTYQAIFGSVGVAAAGDAIANNGTVNVGDIKSLVAAFTKAGIPESDAVQLADIIQQDGRGSATEPFSERAQKWLASKAKEIADGAWGMSWSVATEVVTQATKNYLGL